MIDLTDCAKFSLNVEFIKVDTDTTVPGRRDISGFVTFDSKDNMEQFKEIYQNSEKVITEGLVDVDGVEVPFISQMFVTELMDKLHSINSNEDVGNCKMQSCDKVYFDFSGLNEDQLKKVWELLYA